MRSDRPTGGFRPEIPAAVLEITFRHSALQPSAPDTHARALPQSRPGTSRSDEQRGSIRLSPIAARFAMTNVSSPSDVANFTFVGRGEFAASCRPRVRADRSTRRSLRAARRSRARSRSPACLPWSSAASSVLCVVTTGFCLRRDDLLRRQAVAMHDVRDRHAQAGDVLHGMRAVHAARREQHIGAAPVRLRGERAVKEERDVAARTSADDI